MNKQNIDVPEAVYDPWPSSKVSLAGTRKSVVQFCLLSVKAHQTMLIALAVWAQVTCEGNTDTKGSDHVILPPQLGSPQNAFCCFSFLFTTCLPNPPTIPVESLHHQVCRCKAQMNVQVDAGNPWILTIVFIVNLHKSLQERPISHYTEHSIHLVNTSSTTSLTVPHVCIHARNNRCYLLQYHTSLQYKILMLIFFIGKSH